MGKEPQLEAIVEFGVAAVIRTKSADELVGICNAMADGGVGVEITTTSPGAIEPICQASKEPKEKAIIGVGSVLDAESAQAAMLADADFVVCLVLNLEVMKLCANVTEGWSFQVCLRQQRSWLHEKPGPR